MAVLFKKKNNKTLAKPKPLDVTPAQRALLSLITGTSKNYVFLELIHNGLVQRARLDTDTGAITFLGKVV